MRRVVPPIAPGPDLGRPEMLPPARDLLLRDGQVRPPTDRDFAKPPHLRNYCSRKPLRTAAGIAITRSGGGDERNGH